jgi:pSer/pThr/pTyr-binding forkhead associated (FHA) protein
MLCGNCQTDNPSSNAFCHACGAWIDGQKAAEMKACPADDELFRCPKCDAANRPTMRFCRECGTRLAPQKARSNSVPPPDVLIRPKGPVQNVGSEETGEEPKPPVGSHICSGCGAKADRMAIFCPACGALLEAPIPVQIPGIHPVSALKPDAKPKLRAQIVIILRNGTEGNIYPLEEDNTDIGSREGAIVIEDDPFLSHRHARITRKSDTFVLTDLSEINGIYVRIREPVDLVDKDMILIGQQVLRFEVIPEARRSVGPAIQHGVMVFGTPETPRIARLVQYTTDGLERDVYYLNREETVLGREHADVIFPDDPFLSRRHASISMNAEPTRFILRDLGSSNGTAVRCRNERVLRHGDQFRIGRHLFRFDLVQSMREERN